jgi:hypothetical protein
MTFILSIFQQFNMDITETIESTATEILVIEPNAKKRKKFISSIYDHFKPISKDRSQCKICSLSFCKRISNFKRHLQTLHPNIYNETCIDPKCPENGQSIQPEEKGIKVRMSKSKLVRICIDLVTEENHPFFFLDTPAMQALINPYAVGMTSTYREPKFDFNSTNIRQLIMTTASSIRTAIMLELNQKMISVKVVIVNWNQKIMREISVQFAEDDIVKSHTLAVTQLTEDEHSFTNNQAGIIDTLKRYNIEMEQVVSFDFDTGENVLENSKDKQDNTLGESNVHYETNIRKYMKVQSVNRIGTIQVDRCPVYLAQLCAFDLINNREIWKMILKCRQITKNIRKTLNHIEVVSMKKKQPILDSGACWLTTYEMISSIKDCRTELSSVLRSYIRNICDTTVSIDNDYWEFVDAYSVLLQPVYNSMIKYQSENLNYSDFYEIWFFFLGSQWCNGLRHAFNISPLRSQVQSPVLALIFI